MAWGMTETILDKSTFNPKESSDWLCLAEETIALDKAFSLPNGWHWFWVIYHLQKQNHIPNFDLEKIQGVMPYEHWQIAQQKEDDKQETLVNRTNNDPAGKATYISETPTISLRKKIKKWAENVTIPNKITKIKIFNNSINKPIDLSNFIFPVDADFSNVTFLQDIIFTSALFFENADFENATFQAEISSNKRTANFRNTTFKKIADFRNATFWRYANFRYSIFDGRANFQQATFELHAPRFYGAKFNNEIIFNRIKLPEAKRDKQNEIFLNPNEMSLNPIELSKDEKDKQKKFEFYQKKVEENESAYGTLVYLMEGQNKHHDKHLFFREEMRWRQLENYLIKKRLTIDVIKQKDDRCISWRRIKIRWKRLENRLTIVFFWLYGILSDYGYGIGRTFSWWLCHIGIGIVAIIVMVLFSLLWECWKDWWDFGKSLICAVPVSFSNANPLAFIGFEKGGLMYCYSKLNALTPFGFGMIRAFQIIVGIPLLFLLLVTLRVRFRIK